MAARFSYIEGTFSVMKNFTASLLYRFSISTWTLLLSKSTSDSDATRKWNLRQDVRASKKQQRRAYELTTLTLTLPTNQSQD